MWWSTDHKIKKAQDDMSQRSINRIGTYGERNPNTRRKLGSILDAFEYVGDERQDLVLLTRLLNRMVLSPGLASAVCSLGVGYEQLVGTLPPDQVPAFNGIVKSVGRIAVHHPDSIVDLRTRLAVVAGGGDLGDAVVDSLVRTAGLGRVACAAENNRFRTYKCDVPKEVGVDQCGLNTNFACERGISTGGDNCEIADGSNRCRLSAVGKRNKARLEGRRQVWESTAGARAAYNNR